MSSDDKGAPRRAEGAGASSEDSASKGQVSEAASAPVDGHGADIEPLAPSPAPTHAPSTSGSAAGTAQDDTDADTDTDTDDDAGDGGAGEVNDADDADDAGDADEPGGEDADNNEDSEAGAADSEQGLAAFIAASEAAARAEAREGREEEAALWGDEADDDDPGYDDPGYVEVRRSAPGWALSKWIISAVVAAAVIVLSFLMIPRLFTPEDEPAAADPTARGATTTAAAPTTTAPALSYPEVVLGSGPAHYWRFDMQSAGSDEVGGAHLEIGGDAAILGSSSYDGGMGSIDCSGTSKSRALSGLAETPTGDFSIEVWINTVTNEGGPIVTFGNRESSTSTKVDRVMYMATNGDVYFGTQADSRAWAVTETPVNNGTWRHLVGTMSTTAGLTLYVDGQQVATEEDGTSTSDFEGYWKICGDNPSGWTGNSGRPAFTGTIDDVAVYAKALTPQQVLQHYKAAKGQ